MDLFDIMKEQKVNAIPPVCRCDSDADSIECFPFPVRGPRRMAYSVDGRAHDKEISPEAKD